MRSYILKDGEVLPQGMQKIQNHFLLPFRYVVWLCGLISHDDTVQDWNLLQTRLSNKPFIFTAIDLSPNKYLDNPGRPLSLQKFAAHNTSSRNQLGF